MSKKQPKSPQFHVYGLPSSPTNWGEAVDILREQQRQFSKQKRRREGVTDRLAKIERILEKENR